MKRWKTRKYYELSDLLSINYKLLNFEFMNVLENTLDYGIDTHPWGINNNQNN